MGTKWNKKKLAVYSVYKGDDILFTGTIYECAEFLGVKITAARFYTTPSKAKRDKNGTVIVRVDKEDEDDL